MLIFAEEMELVEARLRSRGGRVGGRTDLTATFMFTLSSKSRKEISVDRVATIRGIWELAVWCMKSTMTLKIYLIQESSRGGGSPHDDGVRCPESCGDDCGVQRDAIVTESTFKIRSCDWRTSIVTWPVRGSICWRKKNKIMLLELLLIVVVVQNSLSQDGPTIRWEPRQSYPTNLWRAPPKSQSPVLSAYQILRDPMEHLSCKAAKGRRNLIHEVRLVLKDLVFEPIHEYLDSLLLGCSRSP